MKRGEKMTKEECVKLKNSFKLVSHNGFKAYVNPLGEVCVWNGKEYVKRQWRINADGYVVVTLQNNKQYRSVGVHILVAKGWVPNFFQKPEVNHLDFNRKNPSAYNLEWVTHQENVKYSKDAGRYPDLSGKNNPNYNNNTLHLKYKNNKKLSKEKQGRHGGKNGRAKSCQLFYEREKLIGTFDCQRDAVNYLINLGLVKKENNKETIIHYLKQDNGYKNYYLKII